MANYRYKVCKGQKVVAVSTTLHEAEAEAKRIGGIVLRVGVHNPPSKGYDTFLGGGAFSKAYARKPPVKKFRDEMGNEYALDAGNQAVEAITKRGGMNDSSLYDAMKTAIVLARKKLAKAPEALKYLPEIVPVRLDNEPPDSLAYLRGEQGAREYVYAMPVYDQLRARMQNGEPIPRLALELYQLVHRNVTGRGSLREAARLFADEIANEERQGRLVSPVLEQVKAEEPHIVKVLNTLHNVIVGMGCGIGDSYYGSDLHSGNFALKGDQLILLDPAACDLSQDALDELWYQNGWAKRPAVQNPAPAADQTKTAAFKRWFGKSKVVDKDGKPLAVYHGTRRGGFTVFRPVDAAFTYGYYFTDRKPVAKSYSGSENDPLASKSKEGIYRAYLSLQYPLEIDCRGSDWQSILMQEVLDNISEKEVLELEEALDHGAITLPSDDLLSTDKVCEIAQLLDYDGVILRNVVDYGPYKGLKERELGLAEPSDHFVAFESNQIKSADHNRGTFSRTDPDIRNPAERTWIPPATVAAEARKALELRAKQPPSNRCCTPVGIARAKQLANRQPVSETTLRRMKAYFDRHVVDRKGKGWGVDSKGYQAWLAWGGDSGRDWCKNILRGL